MRNHWKILGLSLLALVGVMAVNASAVQAKWLMLRNLVSVSTLNLLELPTKGSYFLSENGTEIFCTESSGVSTFSLNGAETVLSSSITVTFKGCKEEQFESCSVHSAGQSNGTIVISGTGTVEMQSAEEITATASSSNLSSIEYLGEECPLAESVETLGGILETVELKALQDLKVHETHMRSLNLKLGGANAETHMIGESGPSPLILGTNEEISGATYAFHLCNLGGAACTLKG